MTSIRHHPPRFRAAALAIAVFLGSSATVDADVVVLRNGNEIQGEIIREEDDRIVLRFPGGLLQLRRKDVVEVRRQSRGTYLLEEGDKQLARRDWQTALETFGKALAEDPDCEPAHRRLRTAKLGYAAHLHEIRRYDESVRHYRQILRSNPDDPNAREAIEAIRQEQSEVLEEEKLARRELDGGDLTTGIWRLQNIYDRFPDRRRVVAPILGDSLVDEARRLMRENEWDEAAARFDDAISVAPTRVERVRKHYTKCRIRAIAPLIEDGAWEKIEKLARSGLEIAPSSAPLTYYLAMSIDARGGTEDAVELYASIAGVPRPSRPEDAIAELRRRAETVVLEEDSSILVLGDAATREVLPGGYRQLATPHFLVLHRNERLAREVAYVAEQSYAKIFRQLGCQTHWRNACLIHIYATKEEYLDNVNVGAWSGAAHRLKLRRGAFSKHAIYTYQDQPRWSDGILMHEIAHALLVHRMNYPKNVPLWATEGFAVWCEPLYMHVRYDRLLKIEKERRGLIPVARLTGLDSYPDGDVELFYAQSYSLVSWLVRRRGVEHFVEFLRDVSTGRSSLKDALAEHYRLASVLALENRWRASIR